MDFVSDHDDDGDKRLLDMLSTFAANGDVFRILTTDKVIRFRNNDDEGTSSSLENTPVAEVFVRNERPRDKREKNRWGHGVFFAAAKRWSTRSISRVRRRAEVSAQAVHPTLLFLIAITILISRRRRRKVPQSKKNYCELSDSSCKTEAMDPRSQESCRHTEDCFGDEQMAVKQSKCGNADDFHTAEVDRDSSEMLRPHTKKSDLILLANIDTDPATVSPVRESPPTRECILIDTDRSIHVPSLIDEADSLVGGERPCCLSLKACDRRSLTSTVGFAHETDYVEDARQLADKVKSYGMAFREKLNDDGIQLDDRMAIEVAIRRVEFHEAQQRETMKEVRSYAFESHHREVDRSIRYSQHKESMSAQTEDKDWHSKLLSEKSRCEERIFLSACRSIATLVGVKLFVVVTNASHLGVMGLIQTAAFMVSTLDLING